MHPLLSLTVSGAPLTLNSDGTVVDSTGAAQGQWAASATANALSYTPPAGAALSLPIQYGFNANNQLTVAVPAAATVAAAAAVAIEGFLVVENNRALAYYAIENDDPNEPSFAFYLSGAIAIDPAKNVLTVAAGGPTGTLTIQGVANNGATALTPGMADNALDQIEFSALTHNPLPGGSAVDIPAQILLTGKWDVQNGQLVFALNYDQSGTTPSLSVAVAGTIKGVAAGFELYAQGPNPRLLLTLAGKITGTDQSGTWNLALGYAQNILTASGSIQDTVVTPGGSIVIAGTFTITKPGAGALQLGVQLQATWKLTNGQLNVVVSGTNGSYALSLTGNLKVDANWNVSFAVTAGSNAAPSFTISAGYAPPGSATNAQLQLLLSGNQSQLKVGLSLSLTFVNGSLLPTPKPAA